MANRNKYSEAKKLFILNNADTMSIGAIAAHLKSSFYTVKEYMYKHNLLKDQTKQQLKRPEAKYSNTDWSKMYN